MGTDIKIKLEINGNDYKFLAKAIRDNKNLMHMLKAPELIKKELIKGMNIITTILEKSEIKPIQESSGAGLTDALSPSLHSAGMEQQKGGEK